MQVVSLFTLLDPPFLPSPIPFKRIFYSCQVLLCYLPLHCSSLSTFLGFLFPLLSNLLPPLSTLYLLSISLGFHFSHQVIFLNLFFVTFLYTTTPFHLSRVNFVFSPSLLFRPFLWCNSFPYLSSLFFF